MINKLINNNNNIQGSLIKMCGEKVDLFYVYIYYIHNALPSIIITYNGAMWCRIY